MDAEVAAQVNHNRYATWNNLLVVVSEVEKELELQNKGYPTVNTISELNAEPLVAEIKGEKGDYVLEHVVLQEEEEFEVVGELELQHSGYDLLQHNGCAVGPMSELFVNVNDGNKGQSDPEPFEHPLESRSERIQQTMCETYANNSKISATDQDNSSPIVHTSELSFFQFVTLIEEKSVLESCREYEGSKSASV